MLDQRLVVLIPSAEHTRLKEAATRGGVSVGHFVREAIRERLDRDVVEADDRDAAIEMLCREHDPDFDWTRVKRDLVERFDG